MHVSTKKAINARLRDIEKNVTTRLRHYENVAEEGGMAKLPADVAKALARECRSFLALLGDKKELVGVKEEDE